MTGWVEQFRALGLSLLEVFRAEWEALSGDLARSRDHFKLAALLLGLAAVFGFWALGILPFFLGATIVHFTEIPVAGAAAIVLVLYLLLMIGLGLWGVYGYLRKVENPAASFRRRLDDHVEWWQETLLREEEAIEVAAVNDPGAAKPQARPKGER